VHGSRWELGAPLLFIDCDFTIFFSASSLKFLIHMEWVEWISPSLKKRSCIDVLSEIRVNPAIQGTVQITSSTHGRDRSPTSFEPDTPYSIYRTETTCAAVQSRAFHVSGGDPLPESALLLAQVLREHPFESLTTLEL
jgi:hypothetical protein